MWGVAAGPSEKQKCTALGVSVGRANGLFTFSPAVPSGGRVEVQQGDTLIRFISILLAGGKDVLSNFLQIHLENMQNSW